MLFSVAREGPNERAGANALGIFPVIQFSFPDRSKIVPALTRREVRE
jgi:hypothetical protein